MNCGSVDRNPMTMKDARKEQNVLSRIKIQTIVIKVISSLIEC